MPCRANSAAAVQPAGPPPTTITSCVRSIDKDDTPPGNERQAAAPIPRYITYRVGSGRAIAGWLSRRGRTPGLFGVALAVIVLASAVLAGCSGGSSTPTVTGGIEVVAAENFWGSIASQLGGQRVHVYTIVKDPAADPHEYEATAADSIAVAKANYVIINGAGYDTWAQKLLDANPSAGRRVLNVADLLGRKQGDNPHFWYNPDYVAQVADRIARDYSELHPDYASFYSLQHGAFQTALAPYHEIIASIRQTYSGVKIGATESISVYMANALGLDLISPAAFMNAVSQGSDPPGPSVAQFHTQINQKQIAVLVYNDQTATLVTSNIKQLAESNGIPTVGVSETLIPADATFQDWQVQQLSALRDALALSKR